MSINTTTGDLYLCIKQFNARLGDELNLKPGDKVEVLADDSEYNDGWYMGRNIVSQEVGLYPKSFTQLIQNQIAGASLLRSRSRRVSKKNGSSPQTPTNVNKLSESFEKLDTKENKPSASKQVNKTMSDIDQALLELQGATNLSNNAGGHIGKAGTNARHQKNPSAQSLTDDINPLHVAEWTPKQVYSYFALVLGFDLSVADKFAKHKITGTILLELDLTYLKELDFDSFGTRFEVYKEIEKLREVSSRMKSKKASKNQSQIMPSEASDDEFVSPLGSKTSSPQKNKLIDENYSVDDYNNAHSASQGQLLPSAEVREPSYLYNHQRKRSQSFDDLAVYDSKNETSNIDKHSLSKKFTNSTEQKLPEDLSSQNNNGYDGLYLSKTNGSREFPSSAGKATTGTVSRPSSSVYEQSLMSHNRNMSQASNGKEVNRHNRNASVISGHKRRSSLFLFISGNEDSTVENPKQSKGGLLDKHSDSSNSPTKSKRESLVITRKKDTPLDFVEVDSNVESTPSPKKLKSISYKLSEAKLPNGDSKDEKRSASDSTAVSRFKNLRTTSSQNFKNLTTSKKLKTLAFQEGIREINPDEAIKSASFSGWMAKKSGSTLGWRSRYFTLHGTRLSYFTSLRDKREKGLIDITAHKVIPVNTENDVNSNDKYIALYASSTGFGRYCFKLLPPAPGFKKGLTFTQPKTHYFAVETKEEMRGWLKALMTATIDIDDSIPVVSSCSTPTVSLNKAQEMLARAREETKSKDEELRARGFLRDSFDGGYPYNHYSNESNDGQTSVDSTMSPNIDSIDDTTVSSANQHSQNQQQSPYQNQNQNQLQQQPKLSVDTSSKAYKAPTTPQISSQAGFASPYLLASGLLSPRSAQSNGTFSPGGTPRTNLRTNLEAPGETPPSIDSKSPRSVFSNHAGRVLSGGKKKQAEKMLAYSNDGSGNHTFVIKAKK
ncbi:uncharacterized protein PRCAT00001686001 [Priceomyces carsonii]|uniref:uncharacterized protein n=1 Tax=Priceomyces carsonii TaxID=28549 RepID=UPI002ED79294|nr:unnamed protein product [Priceomyces carsonii]